MTLNDELDRIHALPWDKQQGELERLCSELASTIAHRDVEIKQLRGELARAQRQIAAI